MMPAAHPSSRRPPRDLDTITRRVNAERLSILGWGRAILMQFAHPLVAAGVAQHSGFRLHPLAPVRRLHGTLHAMLAFTFGTRTEVQQTADDINRVHDSVHGTTEGPAGRYPAGTSYSAHDPELLLWVHATLLDSVPLVYELFVRPLSPAEWDAYCEESVPVATALGVPESWLPRTRAHLHSYLREMMQSDRIAVSPVARELAHDLLYPAGWRTAWPVMRLHQLVTIGLLPTRLRLAYGLPWSTAEQERLVRWILLIRAFWPRLPRAIRHWRYP